MLRFELDDQTPEDLAVGLERLRVTPGVLDVLQTPGFGKKGRMVAQIQVLTTASAIDAVVETCLAETTTLGVRVERTERCILDARERDPHRCGWPRDPHQDGRAAERHAKCKGRDGRHCRCFERS